MPLNVDVKFYVSGVQVPHWLRQVVGAAINLRLTYIERGAQLHVLNCVYSIDTLRNGRLPTQDGRVSGGSTPSD